MSNSENIWKIQKKIVKRYEKYERKVGWIVKWYGKLEEKYVEMWHEMENMKEK